MVDIKWQNKYSAAKVSPNTTCFSSDVICDRNVLTSACSWLKAEMQNKYFYLYEMNNKLIFNKMPKEMWNSDS